METKERKQINVYYEDWYTLKEWALKNNLRLNQAFHVLTDIIRKGENNNGQENKD